MTEQKYQQARRRIFHDREIPCEKDNRAGGLEGNRAGIEEHDEPRASYAVLSAGTVRVEGVLFSDDSRHFLACLVALGFTVEIEEEKKCVTVTGCGGRIPRGEAVIDVGSAGTAARFLAAMLGFSDGCYEIRCSAQMKPAADGRNCSICFPVRERRLHSSRRKGIFPVRITGCRYARADKTAGETPRELSLDITKSTQFLSALLLIAPMVPEGMKIHITSEKTDGSYIRITRKMMQEFGVSVAFDGRDYEVPCRSSYRKETYMVEPDMSAACYFYAAAAVTGGRALVRHVHMDNTQGDLRFLEVLEHMGCTADDTPEGILVTGPADGALRGITVNMNDFSDQALTWRRSRRLPDAPGAHRGNRTYPWAGMRPDSRDTDEPDSAWHPV